jgi:hypothetical protein
MEYLVTTGRGTYRIEAGVPEVDDIVAVLDWLVESHAVGGPGPLEVLSRQQVLAMLGRPTLPEDKENPFPEPDVIVGEQAAGGFVRGWLAWKVDDWQNGRYRRAAAASRSGGSGGEGSALQGDAAAPTAAAQVVEAPRGEGTAQAGAGGGQDRDVWVKNTRRWEAPVAADDRVLIVASRGVVRPSGWVVTRHRPQSIPNMLAAQWPKPPKRFVPQIWFTAEAMDAMGLPVEDADPGRVAEIVANHFGCQVSWHLSGFFTCRWNLAGTDAGAGAAVDDGGEGGTEDDPNDDVMRRCAQLVFVPWLVFDPAEARPNDLGVAGIIGKDTLLPEAECDALPILGERIAWLAGFGEGVVPAARWSNPGAAFADVKRRASTIKNVKASPFPGEVLAAQSIIDPDLHVAKRRHDKKGNFRRVLTDQRSAYLASAVKLDFGYGEPSRVGNPDPAVLDSQDTPFGLWRVTTPPGKTIDGLDEKFARLRALPVAYMDWEEERTFWTTTRGVKHLMSPTDQGGAGLSSVELAADAAWVWPEKFRLLRSWADAIRERILEAEREGRQDRVDMLKAMYKAFLGRLNSPKWSGLQQHWRQPVWHSAIMADTRARALAFAVPIAHDHGLYPVAADVDAWTYWLAPDVDVSVLEEPEAFRGHRGKPGAKPDANPINGKYRIKEIVEPQSDSESDFVGDRR